MSCEKRPCPGTCAEPFGPPTHCCPDCHGNEVPGRGAHRTCILCCYINSASSNLTAGEILSHFGNRKIKLCGQVALPTLRKTLQFPYAQECPQKLPLFVSHEIWSGGRGRAMGVGGLAGFLALSEASRGAPLRLPACAHGCVFVSNWVFNLGEIKPFCPCFCLCILCHPNLISWLKSLQTLHEL